MRPGDIMIYRCPACGAEVACESLMSANTFGALYYSDGYISSSMFPDVPSITRCFRCYNIFWLYKERLVDQKPFFYDLSYTNIGLARTLTMNEYFEAIERKIFRSDKDELHLRKMIWWGFNHRVRNGRELFETEDESEMWKENCTRLIELLDSNDIDERIMKADLHRCLGRFEECMQIINNISEAGYEKLKTKFDKQCIEKNTKVFCLN